MLTCEIFPRRRDARLTYDDLRSPRHVEASVVDAGVGLEHDEDRGTAGDGVGRQPVTAVATDTRRRLVVDAVVDGQRVEQARALSLDTQSREMDSDYLTNATSQPVTEQMQGTTPGARRRGRPRTAWMDNIKTWTGLSVEESIRMTEDRDKWRKYVHGVANPRIEDG